MDRLSLVLAAASVAVSAPLAGDGIAEWDAPVAEAAARFGIPEDWIWRVMRAESGGRTTLNGRPITSVKGAMGLMQLMPATYAEMARLHGLGADPYAPRDNILAGAAYLRMMYDRFGYPGLFAAYSAGPERYAAHLRTGKSLPAETRNYLARVTATPFVPPGGATGSPPARPPVALFFDLAGQRGAPDSTPTPAPRGGIFVQLSPADAPR